MPFTVIDAAFADVAPGQSLVAQAERGDVEELGKFWGWPKWPAFAIAAGMSTRVA